ncbi:MAG: hypothetical protein ABI172_01985 [Ginsengibacter sp.]
MKRFLKIYNPLFDANKQEFYIFVGMVTKSIVQKWALIVIGFAFSTGVKSQVIRDSIIVHYPDTVFLKPIDTLLRIKNFSPYFTLHVDSTLEYHFEINRDPVQYYWYLKNSPVGLKINKDNGVLRFKAEKSFFLSGKLKYDHEYKVRLGVQNLNDVADKVDTSFTLLFYNTDIVPSKVKPTVSNNLTIDEGDTLNFKLQCEDGSFPIESLTYSSNYPIRSTTPVTHCGDDFSWVAPYDFIKEDENVKQKKLIINFIGVDKFFNRDTATVSVMVNQTINYPQRLIEYDKISQYIEKYIVQLKSTFRILDQKIKHTKNTRTTFDLTSASTALGGTIFSSLPNQNQQTTGKILPSVGVALVPVKEAVAPNKNYEQNSASLVRSDIKRLQYLLTDNMLIGDKDNDIIKKTNRLKDELKQVQLQLIDVPVVEDATDSKDLDKYFNNPKVNKKYRLKDK